MARERNPARDAALKEFVKSGGKVTNRELAEKFGVSVEQIRKWKSLDKWSDKIKRRRGAPKGNQNAVNAGAPRRNTNAESHGAYSRVYLDSLTQEQREYIENYEVKDIREKYHTELKLLKLKQLDLQNKIKLYDAIIEGGEVIETHYLDKLVKTDSAAGHSETSIEVSAFQRRNILEEQFNKIEAKIIKCLDCIRAYDSDNRRLDIDERRYQLAKQKISGEFTISEDGDIIDSTDLISEKVL